MIRAPQEGFLKKRWVYKLQDLKLDPLKFPDEEARLYDDSVKVGNLEAPKIILSEEDEVRESRKYSLFDNYVQVFEYCRYVRKQGSVPHLYEICPYFMKIHFDIDIGKEDRSDAFELFDGNNKYTLLLKPILESAEMVFKNLFPTNYDPEEFVNNILVFEAHRSNKISFHVVIDRFYLPCHECWLFYKEVVDHLNDTGREMQASVIDPSVYKKNQSFRLYGSNKAKLKTREGIKEMYGGPELIINEEGKRFSKDTMINSSFVNEDFSRDMLNLRMLERSLLSNVLCSVRLSLQKQKTNGGNLKKIEPREHNATTININDDELKRTLEIFFNSPISKTKTGDNAFVFDKYISRGGVICLRRTKENHCRICERDHDGENPFLYITSTGDVNYVCRRAQESKMKGGSSMYLGNITS